MHPVHRLLRYLPIGAILFAILWSHLVLAGPQKAERPSTAMLKTDKTNESKGATDFRKQHVGGEPTWYAQPKKPIQIEGFVQLAAGWTDRNSPNIEPRPLFSVHRARLFMRGKAETRLSYLLHFAFDRIGADEYALLQGSPLNAQRPVGVQDALFQYNYGKGKFRTTGGFFRPQVGRENNTPVPMLSTHEPALTSTLTRRLSVDAGHGRASGVNLGGRINIGGKSIILYNLGTFAPVTADTSDQEKYTSSQGEKSSLLVAGNLIYATGSHKQFRAGDLLVMPSPWDDSFGLHIGASGAIRGETDFHRGTQIQTYFANLYTGGFHLDGEFVMGLRTVPTATDDADGVNTAWHVRGGYHIKLSQSLLSPFFMYSQLASDNFGEGFLNDGFSALQMFAGTTNILNAGLNWHLHQHRVRLGVHGLHVTTEPTETGQLTSPAREGWSTFLTLQVAR